jgi:hypothetical protein
MAVDERSRHALHTKLEELLGPEKASVLMEHLPPVGWADVATKRDVDNLAAATKRDVGNLAAATKRDMDNLAAAMDLKLDALRNELLAHFRAELNAQTRTMVQWLIFATSASTVTVAALAFGAARLV